MARNYGISVDEAKRRVLLQREVEALGKELRQQPNFSGIEIVADSNNFAVNVSFAQGAPIPQGVLDRFPNLKPSLRVRQTGREIAAQRSLRGRVTAALARAKVDASIGQKSIDGGLIIQTNDVEKVRTFLAGIDGDIEIVYNPNPVPPPTVNLHGGQEMSGCTSGFGAADYLDPNKKGMLSAGHCVISWGGTVSSGTTVYTQGAYLPVPRAKFYEEDDFLWAYSS